MFTHNIRVRYAETDQMGVVYYANFFIYFEEARGELLRSVDYPYSQLEKEGIFVPVVEAYAKYEAPAYYEDLLAITLVVSELKRSSFKFLYEVKRASSREEKFLVKGFTRHVLVNKSWRLVKMPEALKIALNRYKGY